MIDGGKSVMENLSDLHVMSETVCAGNVPKERF